MCATREANGATGHAIDQHQHPIGFDMEVWLGFHSPLSGWSPSLRGTVRQSAPDRYDALLGHVLAALSSELHVAFVDQASPRVEPRHCNALCCIANAMHEYIAMKTASIPSIRVEPALRQAAEAVLQEGESLSSFVEQSLRSQVAHRQAQREFVARALVSRDEARRTNEYYASAEMLRQLQEMLDGAEKNH